MTGTALVGLPGWVEARLPRLIEDAHAAILTVCRSTGVITASRPGLIAEHAGRRRVHRPWIPEPGMWAQYDFGDGPRIGPAATVLFCLWLAWSRFRVVLPLLDKSQPSVQSAIGVALRRLGGVPTYLLTDNEKTVTIEHVAGIPVRNPAAVEFGQALQADGRHLRAV